MNVLLPTRCQLCPRCCGVNRRDGQRGVCGATDELKVAHAGLHHWEEPPLSGIDVFYGKNFSLQRHRSGSGAVFFSNCPLKCIYCQNKKISANGNGTNITTEELAEIFIDLQKKGANNINLVTGTHYLIQIEQALRLAKNKGLNLPIVWNSSGYERRTIISRISEFVDIWLVDCKYYSPTLSKKFSGVDDYFSIAYGAIQEILLHTNEKFFGDCPRVIVRHLVLPRHIDDSKLVINELYNAFEDDITFSIMNQYTPVLKTSKYTELLRKLSVEEYEEVLDFCDKIGIENYFWQDGDVASNSFIPKFNRT